MKASQSTLLRAWASTAAKSASSRNVLQVYVLPAAHGQFAFHPRFLEPRSPFQLGALVVSVVSRKWRYQINDLLVGPWQQIGVRLLQSGAGSSGPAIGWRLFERINKALIRQPSAEYFLKAIPVTQSIEGIEFIYPSGMDSGVMERHLRDWKIKQPPLFRRSMLLWSCFLPFHFTILSGILGLPLASMLLAYNSFRVNGAFRAFYGSHCMGQLESAGVISWIASDSLQARIQELSDQSHECNSVSSKDEQLIYPGYGCLGDLSDSVIKELERDLQLVGLSRTYKRSRLEYLLHKGSNPKSITSESSHS